MITCKEDLLNTCVDNSCTELRNLYVKAAVKFGIADWRYISDARGTFSCIKPDGKTCWHIGDPHRYRQLTLADFKPAKTKVEYVHVKCGEIAFWEVAKEFAELDTCTIHFLNVHDDMVEVACNDILLSNYKSRNLYRRVETEVTWQDELLGFLASKEYIKANGYAVFNGHVAIPTHIKDADFLELCALVHEANK